MIRMFQAGRRKVWALTALAAVCLAASLPAQEESAPGEYISLDGKAVSKLRLSNGAPD